MARPRRAFGQKSSRLTQWIGPAVQGPVGVASGGATALAFAAFTESQTVIRTRGVVSINPQAVSADVDITGAVGICVVSDEARVAGVASMPEPFTDGDWGGWYVWLPFSFHFEFATAAAVNYPNWNFEIDSKAMRRVSPNETLVCVAESQTGAFEIAASIRTLVKLS